MSKGKGKRIQFGVGIDHGSDRKAVVVLLFGRERLRLPPDEAEILRDAITYAVECCARIDAGEAEPWNEQEFARRFEERFGSPGVVQ